MLAGVAVTILLMLVFLGVVVMWDVALALRDVAEKIDSLEDDVDSDLDTINGTLTRIHDSMHGEQGRTGRSGATADGHGAVADRQSRSGAARAATPNVVAPGVGTPTVSGGQSTIGGLQAARPSPEGVVGQVQLANGRNGRSGSDADAPAGASPAAAGTTAGGAARTADGVDARSVGVDEFDPDGPADQSSDGADADSTTGDGEPADGEGDAVDAADAEDEAPESDGEAAELADEAVEDEETTPRAATDEDSTGSDDAADVEEAEAADDAGATDGDDDGTAEEEGLTEGGLSDDDEPSVADDGEGSPADAEAGATGADVSGDVAGTVDEDDGEQLDGSVAQLFDDDEPADGAIVPDDSATEALRTFGHDARTNHGLGPSRDLFTEPSADETDGRFATTAEEPWYATRFESHPRSTGAIAETTEGGTDDEAVDDEVADDEGADEEAADDDAEAAAAPPLSEFDDESVGMDDLVGAGEADAESGGDDEQAVDEGTAETAREADDEGDVDPSVLDQLDPDADAETAAAAVLRDTEATVEPADGAVDEDVLGSEDAELEGGDRTEAQLGTTADEPMGVGDLVEQELTTLTQEVGGTSISPDVSSLPLQQGADELDDTDYTFPLSGETYGLTASAESEVATLELVPDGGVELSGASEQLLRYQFRNYLDRDESGHAELTVDDDGIVVLKIPGATGDSLDDWADALIQITDRTLYLARGEE